MNFKYATENHKLCLQCQSTTARMLIVTALTRLEKAMRLMLLAIGLCLLAPNASQAQIVYTYGFGSSYQPTPTYRRDASRYDYDSTSYVRSAPYRVVYGSSGYDTLDLQNEYSQYGSRYSSQSWRNPYTSTAPKIYNSSGEYRGRLSTNRYDPDSISNPYGTYGSRYSQESVNKPVQL
jgi:hypothetical protein